MSVNYGSKRIVVGAHYGLRDWLSQRVTAGLMALFTLVVLAQVIFTKGPIGYDKWSGIFASQPMKVLTFAVIVALLAAAITYVVLSVRRRWLLAELNTLLNGQAHEHLAPALEAGRG